jgi:hypothetical protein
VGDDPADAGGDEARSTLGGRGGKLRDAVADVVALGDRAKVNPRIAEILTCYTRTRRFEVLPLAGGILDQPEKLLRIFDVLDDAFEKERARKDALEEAKQSARQGGGHHFVRRSR